MSDTQDTGPLTIDQILDARETSEETPPAEEITTDPVEPDQEELAADDVVEDDAEDADPAEDEAPEAEADEGPQVLTLEEYGDVQIQIGEEVTTLKDLQKGTLRQSDYTRKTQEIAQQAKELEAKEAAIADKQRQLDAAILDASGEEPEPDWIKLAEEDPLGYPLARATWEKRQRERSAAMQAQQQAQQQAAIEFRAKTAQKALEVYPSWTTAEDYKRDEPKRRELALTLFSQEEYDGAMDMRLAALLQMAVEGKTQASAAKVAEKKLGKAPKVLKPGSSKTKADRKAADQAARKRKLSRPHSIDDVLNIRHG